MIIYNYENDFILSNENVFSTWIAALILSEGKQQGEISFVFCDDIYLNKLNNEYLQHDTLTDIITFDYSLGNELSGDIFISTERVLENAGEFMVTFENELKRVMAHGILHLVGYKDKSVEDSAEMRTKENEKMLMFHVER